jgi:SYP7 family syntaxin
MSQPRAVGKQDAELTDLLTKLYGIQEDIGAKPKSTDEEKRDKAANVAVMGQGKKAEKKGSMFLVLKSSIVDRLKAIHKLLNNAKEIIKLQAEIREQIRQGSDEWTEMEAIYKKEARKKKSKFTTEELEVQSELIRRLYVEIEKVKEAQMRGYAKNSAGGAVGIPTKSLYMDAGGGNGGSNKPSWAGTGGGVALTDGQKSQIMQLEERDADFDRQLDEIGEGIQDLAEIAELQGEEVKRQSEMLTAVNNKMDKVNERMVGVNTKMKETLEELGRSGDKLCVDIMCIVLMIGFAAVIYNFAKGGIKK